MMAPLLGCIADDYTGATDLSSMLVRAGMRVVQCFGVPQTTDECTDTDAVVVSLKSRAIPAEDAVQCSLNALQFLQVLGIKQFFFKYCSTFDSTPAGNIGPVADALAESLGASQVLFCPAFPENGRTVYCGHLFVNAVPLHESSMRYHPLNPMTDSNLVRVLQAQSKRRVDVWKRKDSPTVQDDCHWIADAIDEDDLKSVASRAREHRLLTGGSAIARYWAEELIAASKRNIDQRDARTTNREKQAVESLSGHSIVLAGSCSEATRSQITEFEKQYPVYRLDLTLRSVEDTANAALAWTDQNCQTLDRHAIPLLICSSADASAVSFARERWGESQAAIRVEQTFALIAKGLIERGIHRLIVAGGETSGSVMEALRIRAVRIKHEIAPGVPWVETTSTPKLSLALKSGNFGGTRFFLDALECAP
jgi:3-dehydrotetronate 4-kinase